MEVSPQAKAEELIAQHLSAMLVLGNFSYAERIDFAKRNARISAITAKESNANQQEYWAQVQMCVEKYTIA